MTRGHRIILAVLIGATIVGILRHQPLKDWFNDFWRQQHCWDCLTRDGGGR